jgi:2-polyprenyl-3-methyl-5-hydroxy-6-metoxy-1,4-benzoquinol methylase
LKKEQLQDAFGWDVNNWSRALPFWEKHIDFSDLENSKALEIGCRFGGLSLLLALKGSQVFCTDLLEQDEKTRQIHANQNVSDKIDYRAIDVLDIPFENEFDIICFKSVLGGVGRLAASTCRKKRWRKCTKHSSPVEFCFFPKTSKLRGCINQ